MRERETGTAGRTEPFERRTGSPPVESSADLEQREACLRQAVQQLEALYREAPIPALIWRRVGDDFVLMDCNPAARESLGEANCPAPGTRARQYYGRGSAAFSSMTDCLRGKTVPAIQGPSGGAGMGGREEALTSFVFIPPDLVVVQVRESNPQARLKEELHGLQTRYRTLFEYNPIQTIVVDRKGRILDWNRAQREACAREPKAGEIMFLDYGGNSAKDLHAELLDCIECQVTRKLDAVSYEEKYFSVTMAPFPSGAVIATLDVTELKNAEREVRQLTQQILQSEENERRKISWFLHDELIQELACLKMFADALTLDSDRPPAEVIEEVKRLPKKIGQAIKLTRNMSQMLHPRLLDRFGLILAVRETCAEFKEKHGCEVDFDAVGVDEDDLEHNLTVTLYRLIVEALQNIRKHADASRVTIRLIAQERSLHLLIQDDGAGFDKVRQSRAASEGKRLGMSIMKDRTALLKGEMRIETRVGGGTSLRFRFPMEVST